MNATKVYDGFIGLEDRSAALYSKLLKSNDVYSRLPAPIQGPAHVMRKKMELSVAGHFERLSEAASKFHASPVIQRRLSMLLSHKGSE
jgi:hypothetical protein